MQIFLNVMKTINQEIDPAVVNYQQFFGWSVSSQTCVFAHTLLSIGIAFPS